LHAFGILFAETDHLPVIVVAFKTGPNLPFTKAAVKCVAAGNSCDAPALGDGVSTDSLPLKPSLIEVDVTGLPTNADYTCYVAATIGKFDKCVEVTPAPGAVKWTMIFPSYTNAAAFDAAAQAQLCKNIISLVPGGVCSVTGVTNGSAVPTGQVVYESIFDAKALYAALPGSASELATGLKGAPTSIQTELVSPALAGSPPSYYGPSSKSSRRLSRSLML
jgi:hypothetical protein